MDPDPQDPNSKNSLNLDNILLPKKDAPSVDSAQRVDAGTLLNQEQNAHLREPAQKDPSTSASVSQAKSPSPQQEEIAPLQTFQSDIAGVIQDKGVSVVSIAAAEAKRRGTQPVSQDRQMESTPAPHTLHNILFALLGLFLIGGTLGALGYIILSGAPLPQQQNAVSSFIAIDVTKKISVPAAMGGPALMQKLTAEKNAVSISLGLVAQLYIEQAATSTDAAPTYMSTQALFALLAPDMPQALSRDMAPVYILGVHSFGVNQPFLILKIDSYEQGYAGMLAWEQTMKKDLAPLFTYVPAPKIKQPAQDSIATSTATTSTPEIPTLQTGFIDAIVNNHDARVTKDQYGTINFLWTFLDRQTLVITTNPDTLKEIIARLKQAPILSQPSAQ